MQVSVGFNSVSYPRTGKASSLEASGRQGDGAQNPCEDQLNASALGKETMNKINDLTVGEAEAGRKR